ncbi:hypothetical protein BG004_007308 [Podila humilis]|nr:hypothetical protein BG004_007308 [Podila humilis]
MIMNNWRMHHEIDNLTPVKDSTVYPTLSKRKNADELPYRKLYNLEIVDSKTGTEYQNLEDLQSKGPFQARGCVPVSETTYKLASAEKKQSNKVVYIKAVSVVEWTHEFNPENVMEPVFWILSEDVCWYQVQNMHPKYEPWIRPLADICVFLDAIIHAVFTLNVKDNMSAVVAEVSKILGMSKTSVTDALSEYKQQILHLCESDKELKKMRFVKLWQKTKHDSTLVRSRSRSRTISLRGHSADSQVIPSSEHSSAASSPTTSHSRNTLPAFVSKSEPESPPRLSAVSLPMRPKPSPPIVPKSTSPVRQTRSVAAAQAPSPPRVTTLVITPPLKMKPLGPRFSELAPVAVTREDLEDHNDTVEKYEEISAPCPDNCPVHTKPVKMEPIVITRIEGLLHERFVTGNFDDYSAPDCFNCPVGDCPVSISNSICSNLSDFVDCVLVHLAEHDLTVKSHMDWLTEYLITTPASQEDLGNFARKQARPACLQTLNVHLYWALQSGDLQFKSVTSSNIMPFSNAPGRKSRNSYVATGAVIGVKRSRQQNGFLDRRPISSDLIATTSAPTRNVDQRCDPSPPTNLFPSGSNSNREVRQARPQGAVEHSENAEDRRLWRRSSALIIPDTTYISTESVLARATKATLNHDSERDENSSQSDEQDQDQDQSSRAEQNHDDNNVDDAQDQEDYHDHGHDQIHVTEISSGESSVSSGRESPRDESSSPIPHQRDESSLPAPLHRELSNSTTDDDFVDTRKTKSWIRGMTRIGHQPIMPITKANTTVTTTTAKPNGGGSETAAGAAVADVTEIFSSDEDVHFVADTRQSAEPLQKKMRPSNFSPHSTRIWGSNSLSGGGNQGRDGGNGSRSRIKMSMLTHM